MRIEIATMLVAFAAGAVAMVAYTLGGLLGVAFIAVAITAFFYLQLAEQAQKLDKILANHCLLKEILMGMKEDYEAGFAAIDAATTSIAERIQDFIDAQNTGGMTDEEEAAGLVRLGELAGALKAMGKSPTDPVPVPVPDPEPTP